MRIEEEQLLNFITDSGLVSRTDIEKAKTEAEKANESVGKVLVKQGKLTDDELRRMQAYVLGIPFVDLKNQKLDIEILSKIPEPIARSHNIVAFKKTTDTLEVAMLDTEDLSL
jgi:type IV pilus assembly protein PilB